MNIYYDKDADLGKLKGKKIAVIGYGSQGNAHANNLRDGGMEIIVAEAEGSDNWKKAAEAGFEVMSAAMAAKKADVAMMLVPDEYHGPIFDREIAPNIKPGAYLVFAHGFSIHFGQVIPRPDVNVFMVAPKGPGHLVRHQFVNGQGVPCLIAVEQDPSGDTKEVALAYAAGLGAGRAAILETTFREECETDLFGEQAVLCGGLTELMTAGYETLVEAGYAPAMAYFECVHEMKLIVDLLYQDGIANMRYSISNTAKYGDVTRGPRIIDESAREEMKEILGEIQSGEFAREWVLECQANKPVFNALLKKGADHPIEEVGRKLRAMMPWLSKDKLVDKKKN